MDMFGQVSSGVHQMSLAGGSRGAMSGGALGPCGFLMSYVREGGGKGQGPEVPYLGAGGAEFPLQ